jgi:hypothetical protein
MEVTTGEVDCHFLHAIGWRLMAASGARRAFERLRKRNSRGLIKLPLLAGTARSIAGVRDWHGCGSMQERAINLTGVTAWHHVK